MNNHLSSEFLFAKPNILSAFKPIISFCNNAGVRVRGNSRMTEIVKGDQQLKWCGPLQILKSSKLSCATFFIY